MVSIAANIGNRLTKATIDDAIESLNEDAGPVSESIIVVKMEAPQRIPSSFVKGYSHMPVKLYAK